MIQDLIDTGKTIIDQTPQLCARGAYEREKLANLLHLIGGLVKDVGEKLKQGHPPAAKSHQLELLSEELYFRLAFSLGEIKARELARKLRHSYHLAAQLHGQATHGTHTQLHLALLDEAAWYFMVAAKRVRAVHEPTTQHENG